MIDHRKNRLHFHIVVYYAAHNVSYRALGEKLGVPSTSVSGISTTF